MCGRATSGRGWNMCACIPPHAGLLLTSEQIGTSTRLQYTSTQPAYSRPITGQLTLQLYAWQFSTLNILFLSPILLLSLLTLALALWALTRLPTFDPTEPISLVVASAWCDEGVKGELQEAWAKGCDSGDWRAKEVRIGFRGGGLARVRKY
ncbi:hypothetical protein CALVIDRAFT_541057 [Calocera viscosa TUFC12733]|uniref:Uncharacterized protein n=1 Tax=Calocera viscosa (strain TUFC12733) TaxID=1330018 RepID=A0A167I343_CALVF|nr:hypothetical protein CALVIDRAFT_541057 [Calocera viscosa TUFC12733]